MTEVIMPKMGDGMEEGTLIEWLKKEGDKVKSGDIIGTIQTDKATLELEAPGSGVLSGMLIKGGETVPVGKAIAALLKDGEKLPTSWGGESATPASETASAKPEKLIVEPKASNGEKSPEPQDRLKVSPLARNIAEQAGIDLESVTGTGPGGRITEKDLKSATPGKPVTKPIAASAKDETIKLNRTRQITAERTQHSKQFVPHFYVTREVDLEKLMALKDQFVQESAGKISINDFVIKACAVALVEMPQFNASSIDNTSIQQHGNIHIGIAAALEDGLVVPVIRDVQGMTLGQISAKSHELVKKAREGKLHPDEMSGSTFSISNMGMLDVDNFSAIINEPNAAILAVSTARRQVVPIEDKDDEIEIRWRMNITASFDHRVVDGAKGAVFINKIRELLENPTRLLV